MRWWRDTAVRQGLIIFIVLRLLLTVWTVVVLLVQPLPAEADEVLRPYQGQPILDSGMAGLLLGPWQRFDALHYTAIAANGYQSEADSVFPPLYPWLIRALAFPLGSSHTVHMAVAILVANLACLGLFILLHKVAAAEIGPQHATRSVIYLALFPTAFFLLAPYTESLFLLLALASLWSARRGAFWQAGLLGLLASLTRLTGWVLVAPLAYEFWRQRWSVGVVKDVRGVGAGTAVLLPGIGTFLFLVYRWAAGLPPLSDIYRIYWYQQTGLPGYDLLRALQSMFLGAPARAGEFTLWFDFFCALLLLATTILAFRQLGITWGLYAALLLFFMLLPTSELKPLYSFSRYALAFFSTFLLLARWGQNPWINRLVLYPSLILYLYFSGQFFIWGWVA
ncbi:MAG: hypothetical protein HND44_04695 [Chloroflexi bacterium]|nr:hypothetical protein [Ardenticatenaceae bacterium]MBL1127796.1 hypothetical protein [Chloroflexota bacterium]NOG33864.1 hypothetical protein [Chloroflexota bacterium]GIK54805.1 MAG: hypothetical protein BroJett015_04680 [Chloroflexota bacterium]